MDWLASLMNKGAELYSGKAKTIFATDDPSQCIMHFRDDATAFDGVKKATLHRKGQLNNAFNAYIMSYLEAHGIATHFQRQLNESESLVKRLEMIPVECVVRNMAAGSLCKRLGVEEGSDLQPTVFEFFYKDDSLHDPMINDAHIITFGWASEAEIQQLKLLTLKVNDLLVPLFDKADLLLVDFKLEFGRLDNQLVLGDEFTPDGCRVWDKQTRKKLDKDRFRHDLGDVIKGYEIIAKRLGIEVIS